jgi:hypothetical protein
MPVSATDDEERPATALGTIESSEHDASESADQTQMASEDAWFVRPPAGGQYGPASDANLARWIQEGRVGRDTYVWRGGWSSWRLAGDVADRLPARLPPTARSTAELRGEGSEAAIDDRANATHLEVLRARRRSNRRQWLAAVLLLVLVIVLSGLLVWVLQSGAT